MKIIIIGAAIVIWLSLGIIGAGYYRTSLYEGGQYCSVMSSAEDHGDQAVSIIGAITGPALLMAAMVTSGFGETGWSLAPHLCQKYETE